MLVGCGCQSPRKTASLLIAVWIEDERGIVMRPALAGLPIVCPTCLQRSGVKSVHLRPILCYERGVLAGRIRVEAIDPEDGYSAP